MCFLHRPLDFLGIDHDRLAVSAIFAVAVGMIIQVVLGISNVQISNSNWIRGKVQACTVTVLIRMEWRHGVSASSSKGGREVGRQGGREARRQGGGEVGRQGGREAGRQGGRETSTSCFAKLLYLDHLFREKLTIIRLHFLLALVTIAYALEVAMLFYPFFACMSTEHKLIGSMMGLLYTILW